MAALNLSMKVPLGDAGTLTFAIDVEDLAALSPETRASLATTGGEFYDFAAKALDPAYGTEIAVLTRRSPMCSAASADASNRPVLWLRSGRGRV